MSQRDKELLKFAGLDQQKAAALFGCVRQTIANGVKGSVNYFSTPGTIAILNDARQRDYKDIEALVQFVRSNYSLGEQELILWDQVHLAQMKKIAKEAARIILVFNDDVENLKKTAPFALFLEHVLAHHAGILDVMVSSDWVKAYVESLGGKQPRITVINPAVPLPAIALFQILNENDARRAFIFGKFSPAEMLRHEAARLWVYLASLVK
jgi:hypothetical protein